MVGLLQTKKDMKRFYSEEKLDNNVTGLENKSQKVFFLLSCVFIVGCQKLHFAVP